MTRPAPEPRTNPLTLAIEMSNPSMWPDPLLAGEVAVGAMEPGRVRLLATEPITLRTPRDDGLAIAIERLLRRAGVEASSLDRVAVSGGPGGFTSVRIAVTTAKVIAEAVGAGVAVIPTDEAVARAVWKTNGDAGVIAVTLAGKRDSAWVAVFEPIEWDAGPGPAAVFAGVVTAQAFARSQGADRVGLLIADAHTPAGFRDWANERGIETAPPVCTAEAVLVASRFHEAVDPAVALPIYPREPEAVTKWRDRHGAS